MARSPCDGQIDFMRARIADSQPVVTGGRTVTVSGNSMLPLYRHGDQLIVSDVVPVALGDRVLVESRQHGTLGGTLLYKDAQCIALMLGGRSRRDVVVHPGDIDYLGRIVWASQ